MDIIHNISSKNRLLLFTTIMPTGSQQVQMLTLTVAAVVVAYSNAFGVTVGSDVNVNRAYFLKSASSLNTSSLDSLLLSCRYSAEKRALLSRVPEASLNRGLGDRGQRSRVRGGSTTSLHMTVGLSAGAATHRSSLHYNLNNY